MLTEAWTLGSIDYGAGEIRSGFTILALMTNDELLRLVREFTREFDKIQVEELAERLLRTLLRDRRNKC